MVTITFHEPPANWGTPYVLDYRYREEEQVGNITFSYPLRRYPAPRNYHEWFLLQGNRLKNLRKEIGWSQEKLADEIGVDTKTYRRWEAGETQPSWSNHEKLLDLFWEEATLSLRMLLGMRADFGEEFFRDPRYIIKPPP